MASITRLHAYRERMTAGPVMSASPATTEEPLLTQAEFQMVMTAAKHYIREVLRNVPENETNSQRRARGMRMLDLQNAINKLRGQFNPVEGTAALTLFDKC